MKKLIALIATVSVFVGMTATAFATTTPSVAENGAITKNADGSFTLNGEAVEMNVVNDVKENIANNNQTTIVLVEGTEITTSSIQYINQDSKTSFTFIPKDDTTYKAGSKEVVLNAYIGGDGITKTAAGTITYAVDKVEYAVTFVYVNEENTLTTISSTTTTDGKVAQPAEPTREGYTFDGWYTDANYTTAFDFTAALATDTTVYAKYTKEASGGEGISITLSYGDVNADTAVNGIDAALIIQKGVGLVEGFYDGESRAIPETVGDVNADTAVNGIDAALIIQKGVGLVEGFYDANDNPLTTYTYTYVAPVE